MSIYTLISILFMNTVISVKNLVFLVNPMIFTAGRYNLFDESKYRTFDIILMVELGVAAVVFMIIGVRKIIKYMRKHFDDELY